MDLLENVLHANIYVQPVQFFLSIITNFLNIHILSSRTLRSSPCTYYFRTYAILNTIYTCFVCPTQILRSFHVDWSYSKLTCKILSYLLFTFPFQSNFMLILASFDRYFFSSLSCRFHCRNTLKKTKKRIYISTFCSAIYMSPMLIIYYQDNQTKKCFLQRTFYTLIYIFSQVFFYYVLTPILMFSFGYLTIINIRQRTYRTRSLTSSIRTRRTEGQLTRMLILQITVHLILVIPFGILYTMNSFFPSTNTRDILAIRYICVMWQQCDYFLSFFLYILSGNIYRRELQRIFHCIF